VAPNSLADHPARFSPWTKLILLTLVAVGVAICALHWAGAKALIDAGVVRLRAAGPLVFFSAMALLPAIGFPLLPFTVAAGPVFGPTMGVGSVIACAILAVMANVALTHWLAARALRPLVSRLVGRLGYRLPQSQAETAWQVVTLVRLAPGLPFWTQSYLLGLMRIPFLAYMVVSTLIPAGYIVAVVLFGDALWDGRGKTVALSVGLLGFMAGIIHLLRKRQAAMTRPDEIVPTKPMAPAGTSDEVN
jgi:uncharacterized membrane protein YdjX (TVP38/TMEM64 family)